MKQKSSRKSITNRKNTDPNRAVFPEKKSVAAHAATLFDKPSTKGGRAGAVSLKADLRCFKADSQGIDSIKGVFLQDSNDVNSQEKKYQHHEFWR